MSVVDTAKLLGVLHLSEKQLRDIRIAYVLEKANGCVDARGRESQAFKSMMRRFVQKTFATERRSTPGVFDLTAVGREIGRYLEPQRKKTYAQVRVDFEEHDPGDWDNREADSGHDEYGKPL